VLSHVQVAVLGADQAPTTLTGSCGDSPGLACRLVWDLSHDGRAAQVTSQFVAGPVHLLLRVIFVVLLALLIRFVVYRVINRLTERAARTLLPQFRNGAATSRIVRGGLDYRRRRRGTAAAAGEQVTAAEAAAVAEANSSVPAEERGAAGGHGGALNGAGGRGALNGADGSPELAVAAAQAERALIDERRKQRVRALGSVLRSAASVTIFSIAGVTILGDLGINLAPLLASAGVVGIAVGFGAQNLVRDYLSGVFMLVEDQYGVGDVITVGDATGTVESVTLRITRLRSVNGIVWHVRNGAIETVGNESQGWARAVLDFPVPYTADLTTIRTLLADTAAGMWNEPVWRTVMIEKPEVWGAQQVDMTPPPTVIMRVVVKTAPLRQWEVEREMRARVKAALDTAGITPMSAVAN
jgi:small-conductance mechanosensitive channel